MLCGSKCLLADCVTKATEDHYLTQVVVLLLWRWSDLEGQRFTHRREQSEPMDARVQAIHLNRQHWGTEQYRTTGTGGTTAIGETTGNGERLPKKDHRLLCQRSVVERYALVEAEKAHYSIEWMCQILGVSRRGYYQWHNRPEMPTQRQIEDRILAQQIAEIFVQSRCSYGSPRIQGVPRRAAPKRSQPAA